MCHVSIQTNNFDTGTARQNEICPQPKLRNCFPRAERVAVPPAECWNASVLLTSTSWESIGTLEHHQANLKSFHVPKQHPILSQFLRFIAMTPVGAVHGSKEKVFRQLCRCRENLFFQGLPDWCWTAIQRQQHGWAVAVRELVKVQFPKGPNAWESMPWPNSSWFPPTS